MNPVIAAITSALGQFLWQGLIVFVLLRIALYALRKRSPEARYLLSCIALGVMSLLPIVTAIALYDPWALEHNTAAMTLTIRAVWSGSTPVLSRWLTADDPWILRLWLLGVALLSARLVWAGSRVTALRRSGTPADERIAPMAARIARRISTNRTVRVLISTLPTGPSLAGWFRPVILLPASAISNLTPEQLEAVLAHELAHLARYDDLINIVQSVVETLLFYHPAVWWISHRIRHERELCCDDMAVRICGDPIGYAGTLTALERLRIRAPRLAPGATGGSLSYRVRRIAGVPVQEYSPSALPALLVLCAAIAAIGLYSSPAHADVRQLQSRIEYPTAARTAGIQGTVPVEVTANAAGIVTHARARGGPAELKSAAERSVAALRVTPGSQRIDVAFQLAPQQQQFAPQTPAEKSTLEGVIVGAGGQPLSKATVRLNPAGSLKRRESLVPVVTTTDRNGRFLFEHADPGRYSIRAEHGGYIEGYLALLETTPGQRMAGIKIDLVPMATISGKVVDEDGDPMEGVAVRTFAFRYSNGYIFESSSNGAQTDDRGQFRITGVPAGKVRLNLTPREYAGYGSRDEPPQARSGAPSREKSESRYVTTYYPGVLDAENSLPLAVAAGQEIAGLNITMKKVPVFHARGKVVGAPPSSRRKVGDWRQGSGMVFTPLLADGSFDMAGLRSGQHTLIVTGDDTEMGMLAVVPLTIGTEDAELTINVAPPGDLTGTLRIEGPDSQNLSPAGIRIHLESTAWLVFSKDQTVAADGSFRIEGLRPRKYSVQVMGLPPGVYLKSATLAGRDVLTREIDLSSGIGGAPLELVVSTGAAKISGAVTVNEGEPIAGTRLVLIPATPAPERTWLYRRINADTDGRFSADSIPPGKYVLLAVQELAANVEFDPDWLRAHRARGIAVTLEEQSSPQVSVKRITPAQLAEDERTAGQ